MGERGESTDGARSLLFSRKPRKTDAAKRGTHAKTDKLANDRCPWLAQNGQTLARPGVPHGWEISIATIGFASGVQRVQPSLSACLCLLSLGSISVFCIVLCLSLSVFCLSFCPSLPVFFLSYPSLAMAYLMQYESS